MLRYYLCTRLCSLMHTNASDVGTWDLVVVTPSIWCNACFAVSTLVTLVPFFTGSLPKSLLAIALLGPQPSPKSYHFSLMGMLAGWVNTLPLHYHCLSFSQFLWRCFSMLLLQTLIVSACTPLQHRSWSIKLLSLWVLCQWPCLCMQYLCVNGRVEFAIDLWGNWISRPT